MRRNNSPLLSSTIRSGTSRKPLCSEPMGKCRRPSCGGLGRAEDVSQPADLGLRLADDEHLLAGAGLVQFVADAVDVAAEALDRLDLQPAGRFQRRRRHGRRGHGREVEHLLQNVGDGVNADRECLPGRAARVAVAAATPRAVSREARCRHFRRGCTPPLLHRRLIDPFQVLPPLLLQFHRLQQQEPALRRQVVGQVGPVGRAPARRSSRRSLPATPGSAGWKSRTAGSIRSRRRRTRRAPANPSRRRRCRRSRRGRRTRRAIPRPDVLNRPFSTSHLAKLSTATVSPTRSVRVCRCKSLAAGNRLQRLWMLVTTSFGRVGALQPLSRCSRWPKTSSRAARSNDSEAGNRSGFSRVKGPSRRSVRRPDRSAGRRPPAWRGHGRPALAATSAHDDPRLRRESPHGPLADFRRPRRSLACRSRHPASSSNRSDAVAAASAFAIIQVELCGTLTPSIEGASFVRRWSRSCRPVRLRPARR